jgi:hypothetical protein
MKAFICWFLGHIWCGPNGPRRPGIGFLGDECARCGKFPLSVKIRVGS